MSVLYTQRVCQDQGVEHGQSSHIHHETNDPSFIFIEPLVPEPTVTQWGQSETSVRR